MKIRGWSRGRRGWVLDATMRESWPMEVYITRGDFGDGKRYLPEVGYFTGASKPISKPVATKKQAEEIARRYMTMHRDPEAIYRSVMKSWRATRGQYRGGW